MGDKAPPYSQKEVKEEAQKLEKIAGDFVSGKNQQDAFDAWHKELQEISRHGLSSTEEVFKQVAADKQAHSRHGRDSVKTDFDGGHALLSLQPSSIGRLLGNTQHIGAIVDGDTVLSSAMGHKGVRYAGIAKQENQGTIPYYQFRLGK